MRMKRKIHFGAIQITRAVVITILLWLGCEFITAIGFNQICGKDIFAFLDTSNTIILLVTGTVAIVISAVAKNSTIRLGNIVKFYNMFLLVVVGYVFLKDVEWMCKLAYAGIYITTYTLFKYLLTHSENNKILEENKVGLFSEEVVHEELFSESQKKAYVQIIEALDLQEREDSVNIAVIAGWGKGKTSIVNSVIRKLRERKNTEKRYFVLNINAVTFERNADLVEYVNKYFESLFHRYAIESDYLLKDIPYLATLAELIDTEKGSAIRSEIDNLWKWDGFIDIDRERSVFSNKVQHLLKVSGYKNIILVIDDADRRKAESQIERVLAEFSMIKGIICIVLLSDKNDITYRPGRETTGEIEDKDVSSELDKYIHLRIRVGQDNHIEDTKSIKAYMILAYKYIAEKIASLRYVECPNLTKMSILKSNEKYSTAYQRKLMANNNVLFDLFFENLSIRELGFGEALEELVMDYFNNCIEVQNYNKATSKLPEEFKRLFQMQNGMMWNVYKYINVEEFTWIDSVYNAIMQMEGSMLWVLNALKNNEEKKILKPGDAENLFHLNKLILDNLFKQSGTENFKEIPCEIRDYNFSTIMFLAFGEDLDIINIYIKQGKFDLVYRELRDKYQELLNAMVMILTLMDFMTYIRKVMNNYRTFKIQLREAVVLRMNYLDYVLGEWTVSSKTIAQVKGFKEEFAFKDDISIAHGELRDYINNMIYAKYILGYGENDISKKVEQSRRRMVWLTELEGVRYIVIFLLYAEGEEYIIKDVNGNLVKEMPETLRNNVERERKEMIVD